MGKARREIGALTGALIAVSFVSPAAALGSSEARARAEQSVSEAQSEIPSIQARLAKAERRAQSPEERIAAGEMLMRTRDYEGAIDVLSQVVELYRQGKVPERAYADALYLLAESYFRSDQYLSARRHFREIVEGGRRAPYNVYAGRSLGRLVDVALRTDRLDDLDYVFTQMNRLPTSDGSGALAYARGKAYLARGEFASAQSALQSVPAGSEYAHQASYVLGVMLTKQAAGETPGGAEKSTASSRRFAAAIEQFSRVTRMQPDTAEHRHVIDLAWMAIGRLFYESDNYLDAADAYGHVDRSSPEFSTMLYELAWVYVKLGDYQRAQRALEVLAVTAPETLDFADGSLLRADLMLRSGMFERALKLYESVRGQYDPMRERISSFLTSTTDPTVYYDRLVEEDLIVATDELPAEVLQWVREAAQDDRAFSVIDDVTRSRDLIGRSQRLARKLEAVLGSSARAKAFPGLKVGLERTLGLLNQVALARRTLAEGLEDVNDSSLSGEIGRVREQRRALMKRMGWLPVTDGDFSRRDASGERQWNALSQKLQRLTLEADRLQAIVNGLNRVIEDAEEHGVTHDPASRERFKAEIDANERDLQIYRQRIHTLREALEIGRVQIGFGDQRYVDDERIREQFRQVFAREVQLAAAGQAGADAAAYAKSIQPTLSRADAVEAKLEAIKQDLETRVGAEARDVLALVARERSNLDEYTAQLDTLDQNARVLIGEVAMRNFALVRDRLKDIVLRADVGIVQEAWEIREEQLSRVRALQRERAREEQNLNDELREVLDDAGGAL